MAKDPYQYFRIEARELIAGLTRGLLDLEKKAPTPEAVAVLLRLAHTLKGAARVVKQPEISKHAHELEEILAHYRAGDSPVRNEHITAMLSAVDAMTALVGLLGGEQPAPGPVASQTTTMPALPATDELLESVRVENASIDTLQQHVHVASIQLAGLLGQLQTVKQSTQLSGVISAQTGRGLKDSAGALAQLQDGLSTGLERVNAELNEIQAFVNQLRLRPASSIFGLLERAIRDTAQVQSKRVDFHTGGGEHRLDAHVLAALRDALIHVVRNAVAHGIEPEAQRTAAGKPPVGRIQLSVERRANRIAFICRDDGKGLDAVAIRQAAVDRGLLSAGEAAALDSDQLIKLLLKGGLSTAAATTEVSGRGIGLDVVRSTVARLKGSLDIRSVPGVETCVELCVPVSLASVTALRLETRGRTSCVPLDQVRRTVRVREAELVHSKEGVCLVLDGSSIPYIALADVLQLPASRTTVRQLSAVILESDAGQAVLGAERLGSTATVVAQKLPPFMAADDTVIGAFLNEDGEPELLLDPRAIVRRAHTRGAPAVEAAAPVAPPLLVIDDSLTTRMLEQSILESAGYHVDLAVSAENGLEKARERHYGLFIVDVEMPGMSGFEFVEHIRTQPDLRDTPCILVTSRNAPEDRARGKRAGAQAYIVKGEFNQDVLLQTIRGLLDVAHPRTRG